MKPSEEHLSSLAGVWLKRARAKYHEALFIEEVAARQSLEQSAAAYFNCYRDLKELTDTGNLPAYFSLKVFNQETK